MSKTRELSVTAFSAGYDTHWHNKINYRVYFEVNGTPVVTDHGRGWNLVVVDSTTGNVLLCHTYDTHLDEKKASRDLEISLQNISDGAIVALAVFDTGDYDSNSEWGKNLNAAFRTCGGTGREIGFRASYAMIGRKGAEVGTALEKYDADGSPVSINYLTSSQIYLQPVLDIPSLPIQPESPIQEDDYDMCGL